MHRQLARRLSILPRTSGDTCDGNDKLTVDKVHCGFDEDLEVISSLDSHPYLWYVPRSDKWPDDKLTVDEARRRFDENLKLEIEAEAVKSLEQMMYWHLVWEIKATVKLWIP